MVPAITLAEQGFPVPERIAAYYPLNYEKLHRFPSSDAIFHPEGRPLAAGEILVQRNLGRTLQRIAQEGIGVLYGGKLGQELVEAVGTHHSIGDEPGDLVCLIHLANNICKDLGLSYFEAGLLVSVLHISAFAANLGSGVLVDVTGRKVIFQIVSLVVGAAALASGA